MKKKMNIIISVWNIPGAVFATTRVDPVNNTKSEQVFSASELVDHLRKDKKLEVLSCLDAEVCTVVPDTHPDSSFPCVQIGFTEFQNNYKNNYHRKTPVFYEALRAPPPEFKSSPPVFRDYLPELPGRPNVYFLPSFPGFPNLVVPPSTRFNTLEYPHSCMNILVVSDRLKEYLEISFKTIVLTSDAQLDVVDLQQRVGGTSPSLLVMSSKYFQSYTPLRTSLFRQLVNQLRNKK